MARHIILRGHTIGIVGSLKSRIYGDVLASKVVIHNAKEFATYGDIKLNIAVFYIN